MMDSPAGAGPLRVRILLAGTEFFRQRGGIQAVNRLLARAFADFSRVAPLELHVCSLKDRQEDLPPASGAPGVHWHPCSGSRSAFLRCLARQIFTVRPHLVLFTHVNLLRVARMVRWLAPRSRTALLAHGAEVWWSLPVATQEALRALEAIVAPSNFTRDKLICAQGIDPARVRVLPHALDPDWAGQAAQAPAARKGHTLLSVARLSRDDTRWGSKGIETVLRAMPHILSRCPEARHVVVGDGDYRPHLTDLARQLGVAHAVDFRGALDENQMIEAYQHADLFVLPTTLEGFGIVFAEAMWCGLPVVAARAGATPEVVADGETGILVPPDIPEALGSAVAGLLLLSDERRRMGAAARRRVERLYLYPQFAARWHPWLVRCVPEAVYLARHAAVFARPPVAASPPHESPAHAAESVELG
jgi:glycosyltransferase involved in cell wall biosynthesis